MRQHLYKAYPTADKFHAAWKTKKFVACVARSVPGSRLRVLTTCCI